MNVRPEHTTAAIRWGRYVARRLLQGVGVLWAAFTVAFVVLYLLPSDPITIMLSGSGTEFANASPEDLAALRAEFGMDRPVIIQYLAALWDAVRGDFGTSIQRGMPVTELLRSAVGQTLQLGIIAFTIAVVAGTATAVAASLTRSRWLRQVLQSAPAVSVSVPTFWVGLLLTQIFAFELGWVNIFDQTSWRAIVLPAVTLAIPTSAFIAQLLSKSLSTTLGEPYIDVLRSRGAPPSRILFANALRNASLPVLTMLGMIVGNMLAGSVVVETVFSRMGVGRITFEAVSAQDIPVVMGIVVLAAAVFVVVSLLVDLAYPLLDPRVSVSLGLGAATATRETTAPGRGSADAAGPAATGPDSGRLATATGTRRAETAELSRSHT